MNNMTLPINFQWIENNTEDPHQHYKTKHLIPKLERKILKLEKNSKINEVSIKSFNGDDDFGHIIHKENIKTFSPTTLKDLSQLVFMAQQSKIPLVCRGQGHSTYGQAQTECGLIVDMSNFNKIQAPENDRMTIECGAMWKDILTVSLESGLTPPVLTDYFMMICKRSLKIKPIW